MKHCENSDCRLLGKEYETKCFCGEPLVARYQSWFGAWGNRLNDCIQGQSIKATKTISQDLDLTGVRAKLFEIPTRSGQIVALSVCDGQVFAICENEMHWGSYELASSQQTDGALGSIPREWKKVKLESAPVPGPTSILRNKDDLFLLTKTGLTQLNLSTLAAEPKEGRFVDQIFGFDEWIGLVQEPTKSRYHLRFLGQRRDVVSQSPPPMVGWSEGIGIAQSDEVYLVTRDNTAREIYAQANIRRIVRSDAENRLWLAAIEGKQIKIAALGCEDDSVQFEKAIECQLNSPRLVGFTAFDGMAVGIVAGDNRYQWLCQPAANAYGDPTFSPISGFSSIQWFALLPRNDGRLYGVVAGTQAEKAFIHFYRLGDDQHWVSLPDGGKQLGGNFAAAAYADGRLFVACNGLGTKPHGVIYVIEVEG